MKNPKFHIEPAIWAIIIIGLLSMGTLIYINLSWQTAIQKHQRLIDKISLSKENIAEVCCISTDITKRKQMEEIIRQMAYHDPLTSLPNRKLFEERLTMAIAHAIRKKELLSIMYLDLDGFKLVNDTFGHDVGDQFLQCIAERLNGCLRKDDTIARLWGDEFAVLLQGVTDATNINQVAWKIIERFKQPMLIEGKEISATTSIGISIFPDDGEDIKKLLKHADAALYKAKGNGKNTYRYFSWKS